ncbi:MAG: hypothetical protein H7839_15025 [Magnetococcus sp. YQC-5]
MNHGFQYGSLLALFLIGCSGTQSEFTLLPLRFSAKIDLGDMIKNICETFPADKNITSASFRDDEIDRYKIKFYETGYIKKLIIPPDATNPITFSGNTLCHDLRLSFPNEFFIEGAQFTYFQPSKLNSIKYKSIYLPVSAKMKKLVLMKESLVEISSEGYKKFVLGSDATHFNQIFPSGSFVEELSNDEIAVSHNGKKNVFKLKLGDIFYDYNFLSSDKEKYKMKFDLSSRLISLYAPKDVGNEIKIPLNTDFINSDFLIHTSQVKMGGGLVNFSENKSFGIVFEDSKMLGPFLIADGKEIFFGENYILFVLGGHAFHFNLTIPAGSLIKIFENHYAEIYQNNNKFIRINFSDDALKYVTSVGAKKFLFPNEIIMRYRMKFDNNNDLVDIDFDFSKNKLHVPINSDFYQYRNVKIVIKPS